MTHDTPSVVIQSRRDGFRRCGVAHPADATTHPAGTFSVEELAILCDEPMLMVSPAPEGAAEQEGAEDADSRHAALADAVGRLPEGDENAWTKDGKPDARALGAEAGVENVSAAERDAAWDAFRASKASKA